MEKILEALKALLPSDQVQDIAEAVKSMVEEAKQDLEKKYNSELETAYSKIAEEKAEVEKVALEGYEQAAEIIEHLKASLETQRSEFEKELEEGFEEAYEYLQAERKKNTDLEVSLYEEYDKKFKEARDTIVDAIDQYLDKKVSDLYEQVRREVLNDPQMAEHKVVLDKIVDLASDYISDEDFACGTQSKLEDANKKADELASKVKMLESKTIRLSAENNKLHTENTKLNEEVKSSHVLKEQIEAAKKEAVLNEQKAREEKAKKIEGKGQKVTEQIVAEYHNEDSKRSEDETNLIEGISDDYLRLAGIKN